jgi:hypothetical protein
LLDPEGDVHRHPSEDNIIGQFATGYRIHKRRTRDKLSNYYYTVAFGEGRELIADAETAKG